MTFGFTLIEYRETLIRRFFPFQIDKKPDSDCRHVFLAKLLEKED